MKVGAENRSKLVAALVLAGLAILLVGRFLWNSFGSPTPSATAAVSAPTTTTVTAASRSRVRGKKVDTSPRSLDPTLRFDWLKASEDTKYQGTGRNIFQAGVEIPEPGGTGATDHAKVEPPQPPPGPPPPPPINLKFFGFANRVGEPKRIFLSQGEDIFVAAEGDIIDRRYKILHIAPQSVEIEDVLNNNRQNIPLTQG
ncbi:MAG: hypothetical protein LAO18_23720 [Acidobacteriia bacterium]|nr:hypothetical protein [Terriglobia bacterium]